MCVFIYICSDIMNGETPIVWTVEMSVSFIIYTEDNEDTSQLVFFIIIWFVRFLALRPLLDYCASLTW
jgi:hypothetical protein